MLEGEACDRKEVLSWRGGIYSISRGCIRHYGPAYSRWMFLLVGLSKERPILGDHPKAHILDFMKSGGFHADIMKSGKFHVKSKDHLQGIVTLWFKLCRASKCTLLFCTCISYFSKIHNHLFHVQDIQVLALLVVIMLYSIDWSFERKTYTWWSPKSSHSWFHEIWRISGEIHQISHMKSARFRKTNCQEW